MARVYIAGTDKSFEIENESILYNALSDQGFELPHGCLSGSCGACRLEILEGKENLKPATLIEQNTIDAIKGEHPECETIRLGCRVRVLGDVTVKPIKQSSLSPQNKNSYSL